MTRTYRTVRTLLTGYATAIVGMVLGLAVTPRIVSWIGTEGFGAFQTAANYLLLLTPLQLGLAGALQVMLARVMGETRTERIAPLMRAASRLFVRFGLITVLATLTIAGFSHYLIPTKEIGMANQLRWGLGIAALSGLLLPLAVYRPLADARQRGHISHLASFAQTSFISLCSLLLVGLGWGLPGMFLATLLGGAVLTVILVRDGRSLVPLNELFGPVDGIAAAELKRLNLWSILAHVLSQICLLSDKIVLSLFAGTALVTPYVLTLSLSRLASLQLSAVGGSSWAALAELYHLNRIEQMNARLMQLTRITAFLGLAVMVPIAVWNSRFLHAWVGPQNDAGWTVTLLGAANAWMLSLVSLWAWIINGTGRIREVMPSLMVGMVVNLTVSVIATLQWGPIGPLLGTAAQLFGINSWWLPWMLHSHFGIHRSKLARAVLEPLALAIPTTLALYFTFQELPLDDPAMPRLARIAIAVAGMALVAVIYIAVGWFTVLPRADRAELRERLSRRRAVPNR